MGDIMKCSICYGKTGPNTINLLGNYICPLCIKCIAEIDADNIFYDFYKERIKDIIKSKLLSPLSQQP